MAELEASYEDAVAAKRRRVVVTAPHAFPEREVDAAYGATLFGFQRKVVAVALARGRFSVFGNTGVGKSRIALAFADAVARRTKGIFIILSPLTTGRQLVAEARDQMGIATPIRQVRAPPRASDAGDAGLIIVVNYENAEKFFGEGAPTYAGIALDEASILKRFDSKTTELLTESARDIPYRLTLTATPAPNDLDEITNQAAFLGEGTRQYLVGRYFQQTVNNLRKIVLRPYARDAFLGWLAEWSVWFHSPAEIGFPDEAARYVLPALNETFVTAGGDDAAGGDGAAASTSGAARQGIVERAQARRDGRGARTEAVVRLVAEGAGDPSPWVVWATTNEESKALAARIEGAVELTGAMKLEQKEEVLEKFQRGDVRVLVTKTSICGFGLNWQHVHRQVFASINDSWEQYYQAVRRSYRFGQTRDVTVFIVTTQAEHVVRANIERKSRDAQGLWDMLRVRMAAAWRPGAAAADIVTPAPGEHAAVEPRRFKVSDTARLVHGDCVDGMRKYVPDNSVDYCVFSPPFLGLYTYSNMPQDLSNCAGVAQFECQMFPVAVELFRVLVPGRLLSFHVMNVPRTRREFAAESCHSIIDLRGILTRVFEAAGFLLTSEVMIFREAKEALVRTRAPELWHYSYAKDATECRQALGDYLVTFRKPGVNPRPVRHVGAKDVSESARAAAMRMAAEERRAADGAGDGAENDDAGGGDDENDDAGGDDDEGVAGDEVGRGPGDGAGAGAAGIEPTDYKAAKALLASNARWLQLAQPVWFVRTTETLNVRKSLGLPTRELKKDKKKRPADELKEKHATPMALGILRNALELWTNPNDVVLDPFAGVGSTGYVCKEMGRRFIGIELLERYVEAAKLHV